MDSVFWLYFIPYNGDFLFRVLLTNDSKLTWVRYNINIWLLTI